MKKFSACGPLCTSTVLCVALLQMGLGCLGISCVVAGPGIVQSRNTALVLGYPGSQTDQETNVPVLVQPMPRLVINQRAGAYPRLH